ncbi:hypothetical protein TSMEX_007589 [Taenia solium]|eukprot:TsM_000364600 transcript=TsM_000364600 gene=TsM_000364600
MTLGLNFCCRRPHFDFTRIQMSPHICLRVVCSNVGMLEWEKCGDGIGVEVAPPLRYQHVTLQ